MDKVWYYCKEDGKKFGPFSDSELCSLIKNGILAGDDQIWMPEFTEWLRIRDTIYSGFLENSEENK